MQSSWCQLASLNLHAGVAAVDADGAILLVHNDAVLEPCHQHHCQAALEGPYCPQEPLLHLLSPAAAQRLPSTRLLQVAHGYASETFYVHVIRQRASSAL